MIKKLVSDLVKFETVYGNEKEFFECFSYIKEYLKNTDLTIKEYFFNGFRSMVISNCDTKNYDVIFVGHIDVVPGTKQQFTPYINNNKLYGRGTFDMKGHVAIMIEIMKNISVIKTNYNVALFITSDEEQGGFYGVNRLLNEIKYKTKLAIVPDAGNNFDHIIEEKGVLQLKLSYSGKSAHSSLAFDGDNALIHLINMYNELIKKYPLPKNKKDFKTSINLAKLNGGNAINKVCDYAEMYLDIRHISSDLKNDFLNSIKEINPNVIIEVLAQGDEFIYIENDLSLKYLDICEKVLQKKINKNKCESSSDARFFYKKGISCILMNAKGKNLHADQEYIDIESLELLYNIYFDFLNK